MVALPEQNACRVPYPVSTVEGPPVDPRRSLTNETRPSPSTTCSVSLHSHHSCHCYYVIFLTRPSRLRKQRSHLADSPAPDVRRKGVSCCSLSRFGLFVSHPSELKKFWIWRAILLRRALEGGPQWPRSAGTQPFSSVHPAASAISCRTAPPAVTTPP